MAEEKNIDRRSFLKIGARTVGACALLGSSGFLLSKAVKRHAFFIDPEQCIKCTGCETNCVKNISAVKCVNNLEECGLCVHCFGYFVDDNNEAETPENLVCPTRALKRKKIGDETFSYTINEDECIGCGRCVKACWDKGAASMTLQIRGNLCLECNSCTIQNQCPANAVKCQEIT